MSNKSFHNKKKHTEQSKSKFFSSIGQSSRKFTTFKNNTTEVLDEEQQEQERFEAIKYGSRELENNQAQKYDQDEDIEQDDKQMQYYRTLTTLHHPYTETSTDLNNPLQAFASLSTQYITKPWEREWLQLDSSQKSDKGISVTLDLQNLATNLRQLSIEEKLHMEADFDDLHLHPALRISNYKPVATQQQQFEKQIRKSESTLNEKSTVPTKPILEEEQRSQQIMSSTLDLLDTLLEEPTPPPVITTANTNCQPMATSTQQQEPPQDLEDWLDTIL